MTSFRLLIIAGVFAVVGLILFGLFWRISSGVSVSADGIILKKTFKPAGTYTQIPAGINRQTWRSISIPIAECYVFEIRADGLSQNVYLALNTVAGTPFEEGQRVRITYRRRGIPFAAKKYLVLDMRAVEGA